VEEIALDLVKLEQISFETKLVFLKNQFRTNLFRLKARITFKSFKIIMSKLEKSLKLKEKSIEES
jgi:hypothetical protein